jgi:hypothetical protein
MTGFKHEEHVSRRPAELARVTPVDGQRDIRYGAGVYGSFLVASVVGAAFEAGARSGASPLSAVILGALSSSEWGRGCLASSCWSWKA